MLLHELIKIKKESTTPLYIQISNALIILIKNGKLPNRYKLPGSREIARTLDINRMTVVAALTELEAQGWVKSEARKGVFINVNLSEVEEKSNSVKTSTNKVGFLYQKPFEKDFIISDFPDNKMLYINEGFPDIRLAPIEELNRSIRSRFKHQSSNKYLMYGGAQGTLLLRNELSNFINESRGLAITPKNILITKGAQMGIYLASQLILKSEDLVLSAWPGYDTAELTFKNTGAKIKHIAIDEYGMRVDEIEIICKNEVVKMVYVIPHHHYPTTVMLSPERRQKLLRLAAKYKFAIIEDDYDYDFHYASKPIMPMIASDENNMVVYIGTFTKTIAPSVRVGFMIAPEYFINSATQLRKIIDTQGDSIIENAIADMFVDGTIGRHIRKSLKIYRERRDHFCALLQSELGDKISFKIPEGGMSVWIKFNNHNLKEIAQKCFNRGLNINDGCKFDLSEISLNSTRMGFASLNFDEQKKAVAILKYVLNA